MVFRKNGSQKKRDGNEMENFQNIDFGFQKGGKGFQNYFKHVKRTTFGFNIIYET